MINTIALTFQNGKDISGHAGACQNYLIYKIIDKFVVSKELITLSVDEALHNTFHSPTENPNHPIFKVDVLLTGGIGMGGIIRLKSYQVDAFIVDETNPDVAVTKLLDGTLEHLDPNSLQPAGSCGCGGDKHHQHH
ncbi:MAG: nitrogen fixation protein [Flavobacteriales bacterium]|jgi:predicted Fe-Mo cluster-binding NifX family protein|nr:nitrogen fixation protein [Flavobacteriales bacterium]